MFNITLNKQEIKDEYDIIAVGAGPAAYSAGIYAARFKLSCLAIGEELGGTAAESVEVENYPGLFKITGEDLMNKFKAHAESLGVTVLEERVVNITKEDKMFIVSTGNNKKIKAKAIILATGSKKRKLNIENEDKFLGHGISYCATCDAAFFKDKVVGVVGGGDAAVNSGLVLAGFAKKVYMFVRRDVFRAAEMWVDKLKHHDNIEILFNTQVKSVDGNGKVEKAILNTNKEIKLDGLFINIGSIPSTDLAEELGVKLDERKHIIVDDGMKTNVEGIFAAGDCTTGSNHVEQIITASAEGAIAADSIFKYIHAKHY